MVQILPPLQSDPTQTSTTTTIYPPPYPWSQTSKDSKLNTKTTTWSPGPPSPSVKKGSKGAGRPCEPWCDGPCLTCLPDWGSLHSGGGTGGSGGSNGNGNDDDDECSTRTAQICSSLCVAGSGCDIDCTTTTGCTATASSTKTVGTLPPGVGITMEHWPTSTSDPKAMTSIAASLDSVLSSMFGSLTVLQGPTATPTGPAPSNGAMLGEIQVFYLSNSQSKDTQWEIYEGYQDGGSPGGKGCPEGNAPDSTLKDGAYYGMGDGQTGIKAFGATCTYKGTNLPINPLDDTGAGVGKLVCDKYRDATCYNDGRDEGTCEVWEEVYSIMTCKW